MRFGIEYAAEQTGRTISALTQLGVANSKEPKPLKKKRLVFADNIANMMELQSQGMSLKTIGAHYNMTASKIKSHLCKARRCGFDAYPKRIV